MLSFLSVIKPKIVIITGPTAVGKTSLALNLAQIFKAEIVNADSMQFYRYMDIGTAKPTLKERGFIPHHLIDIRNPDENYNVAQFKRDADDIIRDIHTRGKQVLVVGGTMLYLKALCYGIFLAPPADMNLREHLNKLAKQKGREFLHQILRKIDPEAAQRIQPKDIARLIRAIEIYKLTAKPISWHQKYHQFATQDYQYLKICLYQHREALYQRIEKRIDGMFAQGLVKEVEALLKMGYTPNLKAMQAIGYRHIVAYLKGNYDIEKAKVLLKTDTRRYAKRQLSWFRQEKDILWYSTKEMEKIRHVVAQFLEK